MDRHNRKALRTILLYGLLLGGLLAAFKFFEYSYFSNRITLDLYLGIVSIAFLLVGIIVGLKGWSQRKGEKNVENKEEKSTEETIVPPSPTVRTLPADPDLSKRELEVLSCLVKGQTNQEIARTLYVSPNTVKTHLGNIYRKLDVERRTQAIARAKELQIIE